MNRWKHFKKICQHKFWVGNYCFRVGLVKQGLLHDLSKFSPTEFNESVRFYQGNSSPIDACKKECGYSEAWLHHRGRNKHHYEYWTDNYDNGGEPLVMPYRYAAEMICDYMGAGRAYYGKTFSFDKEYDWWLEKKKHNLLMHPAIKNFVTRIMKRCAEEDRFVSKKELIAIYNAEVILYYTKGEDKNARN